MVLLDSNSKQPFIFWQDYVLVLCPNCLRRFSYSEWNFPGEIRRLCFLIQIQSSHLYFGRIMCWFFVETIRGGFHIEVAYISSEIRRQCFLIKIQSSHLFFGRIMCWFFVQTMRGGFHIRDEYISSEIRQWCLLIQIQSSHLYFGRIMCMFFDQTSRGGFH